MTTQSDRGLIGDLLHELHNEVHHAAQIAVHDTERNVKAGLRIRDVKQRIRELVAITATSQCQWMNEEESEDGHCWGTECGHVFYLDDGDPASNSMKFCPFCGGSLMRAYHKDQEDT